MRDKIVANLFIVLKAFISIFFFLSFSVLFFFFFIECKFTVIQLELPPSDSSVQLLDNWNITLDTVWLFSYVILPRDHVQNDDFRFIYFFRFFQLKKNKKTLKLFKTFFYYYYFFTSGSLIDWFIFFYFLFIIFIYLFFFYVLILLIYFILHG